MGKSAAKNVLLVILALGVGAGIGAATKLGFGYTLSAGTPSSSTLAAQ